MLNTATRRLINREASAVARARGVVPTFAFLAYVRTAVAEDYAATASIKPTDVGAYGRLTAYCAADCWRPEPTCANRLGCGACAAAAADGVRKGY